MRRHGRQVERCKTISIIQGLLGGKWKIEILYYLAFEDVHRFGELKRCLDDISDSGLTRQLRSLEEDGFIVRHDFREVPPHVEYELSKLGKSFIPVLECLKAWGDENLGDLRCAREDTPAADV